MPLPTRLLAALALGPLSPEYRGEGRDRISGRSPYCPRETAPLRDDAMG